MNTARFPFTDSSLFSARDRVLLYTRGMNIDPEGGLTLALESLRRAGSQATPDSAMRELFALVEEQDHSILMPGTDDASLTSAPPINRTVLLPEDMEPLSLSVALIKWLRNRFPPKQGREEDTV